MRKLCAKWPRHVEMYLASGTDQEDVIAEAQAMGYAALFEGRIFGATGDVHHDAKRIAQQHFLVITRIPNDKNAVQCDAPLDGQITNCQPF